MIAALAELGCDGKGQLAVCAQMRLSLPDPSSSIGCLGLWEAWQRKRGASKGAGRIQSGCALGGCY